MYSPRTGRRRVVMMGTGLTELAILVLCVFLSACFSSSEAAFLSVRKTARLAHLVRGEVPAAVRVARMLEEPGRLLSTILLGNNLVNVALTALITALTLDVVKDEGTGLVVATAIGTAILLVFGEIVPKTVAVRFSMGMAMLFSRPLKAVELMFLPLVVVLQWVTRIAEIGGSDAEIDASITEAELRTLIDIGEEEGQFEPKEAERLERVFRFGDRIVREVMTPRNEIVFVGQGTTLGEFLDIYVDHLHTRFPVYKESTDDIVGILSAKDILKAMASKATAYDDAVTDVLRDVYFVPETKRIAELFDDLRESGNQVAIAIDEFGGVAGLVTLKSLLEEIVGRFGEEGVGPEEEYESIDEHTFQIDGGMSAAEAVEELGIELPEGEFETVAGFVLEALGHIPTHGEQFEYGDTKVEVTRMRGPKIETIKLTKMKRSN
jgi:putative hemolysin